MSGETKRTTHFPSFVGGLCGAKAALADCDTDPAKVTCKRCQAKRARAIAKASKVRR